MEKTDNQNTDVEILDTEETEPVIDLDKFNKKNEEEDKGLTELEKLQKELADERKAREVAEDKAKRNKLAADKATRERAAKARENRELAAKVEEPNEKITEYEEKIAKFELEAKKNEAFLGFTDITGINKEHSGILVSALYHEDTNEVSVPDLMEAFNQVISDVIKASHEKGYNLRDQENASGKPRSIGGKKVEQTAEQQALEMYKQRRNKR